MDGEKPTWLEAQLAQVSARDIEKVDLADASGLFSHVSTNTFHPKTGERGSEDPKFLSTSVKWDKSEGSEDEFIKDVRLKGMYLVPAGKHGTKNTCCAAGNCSGPCIDEQGRLPFRVQNMMARNTMLEKYPAESLALIAHEAHTFFNKTIREGLHPSLRLDGTSELHIDNMEAGDYIYGGKTGKYQEIHQSGKFKGMPMASGSEYGKRYALAARGGRPTPMSRQPNVKRVDSWSEHLTDVRAEELRSEGRSIALPATNYGTSTHPKRLPSHIDMNLKREDGKGRTTSSFPAVDFDTDDFRFKTPEEPSVGVLRAKTPKFGHKLSEKAQRQSGVFLQEHYPSVGASVPVDMTRRRPSRKQM